MKTNEERLKHLMDCLDRQTHVKPEQIPDIDLYMDQVTTFMEEHLKDTRRYPDDKVLTKTMINNYAKNNLLPPQRPGYMSQQDIACSVCTVDHAPGKGVMQCKEFLNYNSTFPADICKQRLYKLGL